MKHINIKIKKRFWKIYFAVLAVAVVLTAVYFFVFWNVMYSYEKSRPETVLKNYLADKKSEICMLLESAIDNVTVLSEFDNREAAAGCLYDEILTDGISLSQNDVKSSETEKVYTAYSGNTVFAQVTFSQTGEKSYGFEGLAVESFDIVTDFVSEKTFDYDIVTPLGAELYFGEIRVDERYIVEGGCQYPVNGAYEKGKAQNHFCNLWKITGVISHCSFNVILDGEQLTDFVTISGQTVYLFPKTYYRNYIVTVPENSDIKINGCVPSDNDIIDGYNEDYSNIYSFFDVKYGESVKSVSYMLEGLLEEPNVTGTFDGIKLSVMKKNESGDIRLIYGWHDSDTETLEIKVPGNFAVNLNGKAVSDNYLNRTEDYFNAEYFSSYVSDFPMWKVYVIPGLSGDVEVSVVDDDGVCLDVLSDEMDGNIHRILYLVPESEFSKSEEKDFACDFVKSYINYIGNGWYETDENLSDVLSYMKWGTQSYSDVSKSIKAIVFNSPYKNIIYNKLDATEYRYYGDGCFSCTVETSVDYLTSGGEEHSDTCFELYVVEINGYYKIVHLNII